VQWTAKNFPAKKYCLILWNHGVGILNPMFGDPLRFFMQNRSMLEEGNIDVNNFLEASEEEHKFSESIHKQGENRGILFDDENKCYLDNVGLKKALEAITSPSILNQKLEYIGFDACFMSMLEVAFQIRKYAHFMIGSQELELAKGWNYNYIFTKLNERSSKSGIEMARDIVQGFEQHYQGRTQLFTQSAIDLNRVNSVKDSHSEIVIAIKDNLMLHGKKMLSAITKARKSCVQFSAKFYIDLYSFYKQLIIKTLSESGIAKSAESHTDQNLMTYDNNFLTAKGYNIKTINLVEKLKEGMRRIEQAVVENTTSSSFSEAKGISIYFPTTKSLDQSYIENDFSSECQWQELLSNICEIMH
jgi:hypothetical protein